MTDTGRSQAVWVAADPEQLVWARWDDGATLLHRPSGKTHFLNPASVFLLELFGRGPLDARDAAAALARQERVEPSPAYVAQIEVILRRFEQLGLVRCLHAL